MEYENTWLATFGYETFYRSKCFSTQYFRMANDWTFSTKSACCAFQVFSHIHFSSLNRNFNFRFANQTLCAGPFRNIRTRNLPRFYPKKKIRGRVTKQIRHRTIRTAESRAFCPYPSLFGWWSRNGLFKLLIKMTLIRFVETKRKTKIRSYEPPRKISPDRNLFFFLSQDLSWDLFLCALFICDFGFVVYIQKYLTFRLILSLSWQFEGEKFELSYDSQLNPRFSKVFETTVLTALPFFSVWKVGGSSPSVMIFKDKEESG